MSLTETFSVTGSHTQTLIEQIQGDVAHLRLQAELQERDAEALGNSSVRALASEDGLSIASYQLPLRRYLDETESLLDPESFPSRNGSNHELDLRDNEENREELTKSVLLDDDAAQKDLSNSHLKKDHDDDHALPPKHLNDEVKELRHRFDKLLRLPGTEYQETLTRKLVGRPSAVRIALLDTGLELQELTTIEKSHIKDCKSWLNMGLLSDIDDEPDVCSGDLDGHGTRAAALLSQWVPGVDLYAAQVFETWSDDVRRLSSIIQRSVAVCLSTLGVSLG